MIEGGRQWGRGGLVWKSLSDEGTSHPGVNVKKGKSYDKILAKNIPVKGISQGMTSRRGGTHHHSEKVEGLYV